jgi:hypothetical protein
MHATSSGRDTATEKEDCCNDRPHWALKCCLFGTRGPNPLTLSVSDAAAVAAGTSQWWNLRVSNESRQER